MITLFPCYGWSEYDIRAAGKKNLIRERNAIYHYNSRRAASDIHPQPNYSEHVKRLFHNRLRGYFMSTQYPFIYLENFLRMYIDGKGLLANFYASELDNFAVGSEIRVNLNMSRHINQPIAEGQKFCYDLVVSRVDNSKVKLEIFDKITAGPSEVQLII